MIWGRSRDHQQSATVADLFTEAGLDARPRAARPLPRVLGAAHLHRPAGRAAVHFRLRERGMRPGCGRRTRSGPVSGTSDFFARDGVLGLIDGAVYRQRGPLDEARARGVPRGDGLLSVSRRSAQRACTSATGSSTTSGAPTTPVCEAIHIPHSAIPRRAGGPLRGRARRGRPRARRDPGSARRPLTRRDVIRSGRRWRPARMTSRAPDRVSAGRGSCWGRRRSPARARRSRPAR